ncbi:MAG TPA: alanine--tRNA ligase [Thermoanaerobaculia bacterium]|nr:alanine--tRNA ligase [Thermoanaerobaculia bacterium]
MVTHVQNRWTSRKVRETFLSFFEEKGHTRVASSSLVPAEDPTLLFTNAGMNQFKDLFLGREKRGYVRATSTQKCVRAGGKHNDLDNVGYTARHHTFFEMLGNFSFGDYFKEEAIDYAWELVTGRYGLDPSRLWATVFTEDDEAAALWERYLPKARIERFGEKDNFWSMGDTGPCGPCSEIHYDQGDGVPGDATPNGTGDRVMEIWNLVFMQFERDASGRMTPLPKPSVDTGAGLERITAILEAKNNNYDTDLFEGIIKKIEELADRKYAGGMAVEDAPFRVIADHARAATMLIADGVIPSNEGRGYVLRRIVRRALRYGRRLDLGTAKPFLDALVEPVLSTFEGIHFATASEVAAASRTARAMLSEEEIRYSKTMSVGADRVGEAISAARREGQTTLPGAAVFRLYDTFGVPLETIEEIASDEGVKVDVPGFESELWGARERSKGASKFEHEGDLPKDDQIDPSWTTEFRGYPEQDFVSLEGAQVLGLFTFRENGLFERADKLSAGQKGWVVTDRSIFYPEGGGQVADRGEFLWKSSEGERRAEVIDARRAPNGKTILHLLRISSGSLVPTQLVAMQVPEWTRRKTQANHTGTHLLHAALRKVLGESVRQMGSLVAPDRLRFDYAASRPTTAEEIREIERLVNEEILRDREVGKAVMSMDEARRKGAIMFFGEKYGERVRVVDVPGFSTELCGGCHVGRTGEIGAFKVISDKGLAAGVRRLEAVTSLNAVERLQRDEEILLQISQIVNTPLDVLPSKLREMADLLRRREKEIAALKRDLALSGGGAGVGAAAMADSGGQPDAGASGHSLSKKGLSSDGAAEEGLHEINGIKVLARRVPSLPANELRNLADTFRSKLKSGVVLLGTELDGKVTLLAAVTADLVARVSANELAQVMAPAVGGKGGGKRDLAQAGGKDAAQIEPALALGVAKVRERLSA